VNHPLQLTRPRPSDSPPLPARGLSTPFFFFLRISGRPLFHFVEDCLMDPESSFRPPFASQRPPLLRSPTLFKFLIRFPPRVATSCPSPFVLPATIPPGHRIRWDFPNFVSCPFYSPSSGAGRTVRGLSKVTGRHFLLYHPCLAFGRHLWKVLLSQPEFHQVSRPLPASFPKAWKAPLSRGYLKSWLGPPPETCSFFQTTNGDSFIKREPARIAGPSPSLIFSVLGVFFFR